MRWTALVPIRIGPAGKSRLGSALDSAAREELARNMAHHVLDVLSRCRSIERIAVLSATPFEHPASGWAKDAGRGLNPEIAAFRERCGRGAMLVIHADLPLLTQVDIEALLAAGAERGAALATDRAGEGTNAIALADGRDFTFRFGPGSRALHCDQDAAMPVVQRTGLSADCDTPEDLAFLKRHGLAL